LGGGLVQSGDLKQGTSGLAGSVGHVCLVPDGRPCTCGLSGCVEQYVSGNGLLTTFREMGGTGAETGIEVGERVHAGDRIALAAAAQTGRYLGRAIAAAAATLDPDIVVIGGGVAAGLSDYLFPPAREALREFGFATTARTPIIPAVYGADASLMGAVVTARRMVVADGTATESRCILASQS
jgi:glucokinase